jgi:hypothetical protein
MIFTWMGELLNIGQNSSNHSGTQTYRHTGRNYFKRMGKADGRHSKINFFVFWGAENIYTSSHKNFKLTFLIITIFSHTYYIYKKVKQVLEN